MTEELKKAIDEAKFYWEKSVFRLNNFETKIVNNYEHALGLAKKEIEDMENTIDDLENGYKLYQRQLSKCVNKIIPEKDKHFAELESKLTAIKEALMTDDKYFIEDDKDNLDGYTDGFSDGRISGIVEQRNRIQMILEAKDESPTV